MKAVSLFSARRRTRSLQPGAALGGEGADLEPYKPLLEIGRGGMGVVTLALARGPEQFAKLVVLKRLHEHLLADAESVQMLIPLFAVGSNDRWTLSVLIFESLLIAQHGADFYTEYFSGRLEPDDARMQQTLATALRLLEYANPDRARLHWEQAAQLVFDGRTAMTVMGDWARTLFDAPGVDVEARYREATFPGTESLFVFACNAFPLPAGAKNDAGARRLLQTLASVEGQTAVGLSRTSIPARLDVDVSPNDALQASKQRLWRSGRVLLAQSGLVPPSFSGDLNEALAAMDRERRVSPAVHALRARYMLLGH